MIRAHHAEPLSLRRGATQVASDLGDLAALQLDLLQRDAVLARRHVFVAMTTSLGATVLGFVAMHTLAAALVIALHAAGLSWGWAAAIIGIAVAAAALGIGLVARAAAARAMSQFDASREELQANYRFLREIIANRA